MVLAAGIHTDGEDAIGDHVSLAAEDKRSD